MKILLLKFFIYFVLIEVALRAGLFFVKDYDFLKPRYSQFDQGLEEIKNISRDKKNILILGGSAISNELPAKMGIQLEDSLNQASKGYKVYNLAMPGRTSRDMAVACSLLSNDIKSKIDLVLYYESINDTRYNCIPEEHFKDDYSHSHAYQELSLMSKHSEMNFILIPYVVDLFLERLNERTGKQLMITDDLDVNPEFLDFGASLKTTKTFKKNLEDILHAFDNTDTEFLLCEYHVYYPEEMMNKDNLGFYKEAKYFKAAGPRTTSGAWGYPWNTIKALSEHNKILEKLAQNSSKAQYLETSSFLSQIHEKYFDVCHFTEEGGTVFAKNIKDRVLKINP